MYNDNYLQHHGIKGMKWGVRRWQNDDGSLTPAGEKRYLKYQGVVDHYTKERPKFSERVTNNIVNASRKGYDIGYGVAEDYDFVAVLGTMLGGMIGTFTALPLSVAQAKYDKVQYKKAASFIDKYKDSYVKDLKRKEEPERES